MKNRQKIVKIIWVNLKAECLIIVVGIILSAIGILLSPYINVEKIMQIYFTQDRISGIATFFTIVIGIYVAVLTVIATSEIGISKKSSKII